MVWCTAIHHASASGIVAACLEIQVRIVHSCLSTIKINAKLLLYDSLEKYFSDFMHPVH
jgi:hypothetical protein